MNEIPYRPLTLEVRSKFAFILSLLASCVLLWSIIFVAYYGKKARDAQAENNGLRLESQRIFARIADIESKIQKLKGLGAVIDQHDFASAQYLAVNAGKNVPLPVYYEEGAAAAAEEEEGPDLLRPLDGHEDSADALAADLWLSQAYNEAAGEAGIGKRLALLVTRMGDLQQHFESISANIKQRKLTLRNIPSLLPVQGVVTSPFGVRRDPFTSARKKHLGIDIAAPFGTPVHAAADGRVEFASYSRTYGWMVVLDHGNGVKTRYAHNSKMEVKSGQKIVKGQKIARVGTSGFSTGNHCHFGIEINGVPVDPEFFLVEKPTYALKSQNHFTYQMNTQPDA